MDLNYREIVRIMGSLCQIISALMILPVIVGLLYGETDSCLAFGLVLVPLFVIGSVLFHVTRNAKHKIHAREGFLIVALTWLLMSGVSTFPFIIQGCIPSFVDAFFEMCSGFSTTGATVLSRIETLPKAMLFWRTFSHWIGGMGILVFTIAFLPSLGREATAILSAETPGPTLSKVTPRMSSTARILYLIYCGMTLAETVLLMAGGMTFFDALTHTFATVGTGGFSNYDAGISYFNSAYIESVITVFMIAAAVNFNLYFFLFTGNFRVLRRDSELKLYGLIIALATVLITLNLVLARGYHPGYGFRTAAFQVASILSTTGFCSENYNIWPTFSLMILFLLYFVGGCASSTGGGVKVVRVLVLVRTIRTAIANRLHPNALTGIKINGEKMEDSTTRGILSFMFLYAISVFIVGLLVSLDNVNVISAFSAAASCIGNVGPGFDSMGPMLNYGFLAAPTKLLLSFAMIAGRLELYTFLVLFTRSYWNPYRA